jgi:hypothetical protein
MTVLDTAVPSTGAHTALTPSQQRILVCLYHHRLLSTRQIYALVADLATNRRGVRARIADMRVRGLIDGVRVAGEPRLMAWFTTPLGAELAEAADAVPSRSYRVTPETAVGPLQEHTLAVNDVGTAFVAHAARLAGHGYECSPLDWTPEIAHRISDQSGGQMLIADAVIRCVVPRRSKRVLVRAFLELDRATMSVERLADKLNAYSRYFAFCPGAGSPGRTVMNARPAWQYLYPAWPKIVFVLAQPFGRRAHLAARLQDLAMLTQRGMQSGNLHEGLAVTACIFEDLVEAGPFAPIHTDLITGESEMRLFADVPNPAR